MVLFTLVSSTLGGLYGAFEVYKDYQSMKKKIAEYVTPDLSNFDKRLTVLEEYNSKNGDYTRDIKNDLKNDIRRLESIVEQVERGNKQSIREIEVDNRNTRKDVETSLSGVRQETQQVRKEIDTKIQKALDNPLSK
jgi:hypothetical protein